MIINNKSSYYFTYSVIYGKNFISNLKSSMSTKKDMKKIKKPSTWKKKKKVTTTILWHDMTWHDMTCWLMAFYPWFIFQFILSNKLVN